VRNYLLFSVIGLPLSSGVTGYGVQSAISAVWVFRAVFVRQLPASLFELDRIAA